jgi:hypothetical protein
LCEFRRFLFNVADGESGSEPVSTAPQRMNFNILNRVQPHGKYLLFPKHYVLEIPVETSFLFLRLWLRIFEIYISGLSVIMPIRFLHTVEREPP